VYEFDGDELYVRAVVRSTKPHPGPYLAGQVEEAWIEPVQVVGVEAEEEGR
jgi:hypothetical protein